MNHCPNHGDYQPWMFTCPKCLRQGLASGDEAQALGTKPEAIAIPAGAVAALSEEVWLEPLGGIDGDIESLAKNKARILLVPETESRVESTKPTAKQSRSHGKKKRYKRRAEMTQLVIPLRRSELLELKGEASLRGLRPATWARMRLLEEARGRG